MQQYKQHHEFEHIARDMAKTFYDELRQSGAEILVIDLYADALLTSLKLNNGSKITYNYLIKDNPNLGTMSVNGMRMNLTMIQTIIMSG